MPFPTLAEEIQQMRDQTPKPKIVIDSVEFEGVKTIPTDVLEKLVTAIKQRQFDANSYWLNEIEGMAREVWQDRGYFQSLVTPVPRLVGDDGLTTRVALTIRVQEGNQFRLGGIQIRSIDMTEKPSVIPPEELRKLIPLEDGEVFNVAKVRQGLDALRKVYASKGYIDFTAAPSTEIDGESRLIRLVLELDEQKQFYIRKVETLGVEPKLAAIFKSRVKSGDLFNNDVIQGFFGEFKSALPEGAWKAMAVQRDVAAGLVDVRLDLRPCPPLPKY